MDQQIFERCANEASLLFEKFKQGTEINVYVTHMVDPLDFYIQPVSFKIYLKLIEAMVPTAPIVPNIYQVVLFKTENIIRRGQVIKSSDQKVFDVFSLDYGTTFKDVPVKDIMEIPELLRKLPNFGIQSSLIFASPADGNTWSGEAISAMKNLVRGKIFTITTESWKSYKAIVTFRQPHDVGFLLINAGLALFDHPPSTISAHDIYLPQPIKRFYFHNKFENRQIIKVKFLFKDPNLGFYVALAERTKFKDTFDCSKYNKITGPLFEGYGLIYKDRNDSLKRAVVEKLLDGQKALVRMIDTGEVIISSLKNLLEGPDEVFVEPILAIYCSILKDDFQLPYFNYNRYFIEDEVFYIKITKLGKKFIFPHEVTISKSPK